MEFDSILASAWREALVAYKANLESLRKPDLLPLDAFYRCELPLLIHGRNPDPFITKPELRRLMQWKLSRGKWRYKIFILHPFHLSTSPFRFSKPFLWFRSVPARGCSISSRLLMNPRSRLRHGRRSNAFLIFQKPSPSSLC